MRKVYYSIVMTGAALLLLSSCVKTPIAPDNPTPEPDTANSTFSGLLISPNYYNIVSFHNNDTLSDGKVARRDTNGVWGIRAGDVIVSKIFFIKYPNAPGGTITFFSNLRAWTEYRNPLYHYTDSLQKWNLLTIGFRMDIPNTFKVGYSFDFPKDTSKSISTLEWSEFVGYEQIISSSTQGVPTLSISSAYAQILSVRFDKIPLSFETPATIESFTLIVNKYTSTPPKRISGRISFKMISGDTPRQIVEMRDGRFDNVRFEYN